MQIKSELRKALLPERKLISSKLRDISSEISKRVISLEEVKNADHILCFVSKELEISTADIFKFAFDTGKAAAAPVCVGEDMIFRYIESFDDLEAGSFSVREPKAYCREAVVTAGTVCITPGLCYNTDGFRIGYGKGYYDRFFAKNKCVKIGVCLEDFIRDFAPDTNDIAVDIVVTQSRVIRSTGRNET